MRLEEYKMIKAIMHDAWTEDFKDIKNCLAFLNGADLEDCLEGYK